MSAPTRLRLPDLLHATDRLLPPGGPPSDALVWCCARRAYSSSLAAAALLDLGLHRATDVVGGYQALAGAGVLAELS